jgi:hypothetical protein
MTQAHLTVREIAERFVPGDEVKMAGQWRQIKHARHFGLGLSTLHFHNYPPVIIGDNTLLDWRRP